MVARSVNNTMNFTLWSEKEKKDHGCDMPSLVKRMALRLRKLRGEDATTTDAFLWRHNYTEYSNNQN